MKHIFRGDLHLYSYLGQFDVTETGALVDLGFAVLHLGTMHPRGALPFLDAMWPRGALPFLDAMWPRGALPFLDAMWPRGALPFLDAMWP
jgi:hypothetical protein